MTVRLLDDEEFQSTPSGGKATGWLRVEARYYRVSIHAFRGEGDTRVVLHQRQLTPFQSTPSGGKATRITSVRVQPPKCFNPRLPGGRRRASPYAP